MRYENEDGQSILLVALAMGFFLIGAVGLGFDGSHIYAQRNLAQNAADSAAIAGVMSIFDLTTGASGTGFSTTGTLTCTTTDTRTPCAYAIKNGFGTSQDTITIDFPSSVPGVALSTNAIYPAVAVRVNVSRNVNTTLMRLLGSTVTTVKATATAAIVNVTSPIPIIVVHPTEPSTFVMKGNTTVQICGGPQRSIQVDSSNSASFSIGGNAAVDLSKGGPLDTAGDCTTPGTGTDFGNWGGPTTQTTINGSSGCAKGNVCVGSKGQYIDPASWIKDPLATVNPPVTTGFPSQTLAGQPTMLKNTTSGTITCPLAAGAHGCTVFSPGIYAAGLAITNTTAIMKPGIYYMGGGNGFSCAANCNISMATGVTDPATSSGGTGTGWDGTNTGGGILVYNAGGGTFNVGSNGTTSLIGSPASSTYMGILFFEDRTAAANTGTSGSHSLGGGGALSIVGTIYLTNTRATMLGSASHFQELHLSGNSGNATTIQGEIIADELTLGGGGVIQMNLNSNAAYNVDQVALVN